MKTDQLDISRRYIKSIVLDCVFIYILDLIPFIVMGLICRGVMDYYFIPFIVISLSYNFFGDLIFRNQSVGKWIMKIQIVQKSSSSLPSVKQIMHRRWLEFLNQENRMWTKSRIDIDARTDTVIVMQKH